jgi:hypothetical protein
VYEAFEGTKRDAEKRLAVLITEIDAGMRGAPTKATIASLAEEWSQTSVGALSPTTRREYRRVLDARILPALGRTRLSQVTTRDLDRYYTDLAEGRTVGGGPLSPRSIRHVHAVISGMLSTSVRWGWLASSPAERARLPRMPTRTVTAPEPGGA